MQTQLVSLTIGPMVEHYLETTPLSQGIIGIQVPGFITVDDLNKLVTELFALGIGTSEIQTVIIPPPQLGTFDASKKADVESIGGRVFRDRNDGIRYNRVYIALYWDDLGKLNSMHHDIFFQVEERQVGGYQVSITDNRELDGDKVVYGNQMKSVVGRLASQSEDKPVDVLFSEKSLIARKPDDYWVRFTGHDDIKLSAGSLSVVLKDHLGEFKELEQTVKEQLANNTFHHGIHAALDYLPQSVVVTIYTNFLGPIIKFDIGSINFSFVLNKTMELDWTQLMIDQLEALVIAPFTNDSVKDKLTMPLTKNNETR